VVFNGHQIRDIPCPVRIAGAMNGIFQEVFRFINMMKHPPLSMQQGDISLLPFFRSCVKHMEIKIERIKIKPYTKNSLEQLKTEENWTFDSVIQLLLDEHFELNDPEILEEKEKKLHEEYVSRPEYERLYGENRDNRKKVTELMDEYESKLEEIKSERNQFATKIKEQQNSYDKLHGILVAKEKELKISDIASNELKENLDNLNILLSDAQKECKKWEADYHRLRNYVDNECLITRRQLTTLSCISFFLSRPLNKKRVFTSQQLRKNLFCDPYWVDSDDIEGVIPLFKYKIFPVRRYLVNDVECFGFDRHYLRR